MRLTPLSMAIGAIILPLAGCGGGSSDSSAPSPVVQTTYQIKAIDGYLRNAIVWFDENKNFVYDNNEVMVRSGTGGVAEFDISQLPADYLTIPVVVQAIAGQTIDEEIGAPVSSGYMMSAPAGESAVTPLSSLVDIQLRNGKTLDEAKQQLASQLGIEEEQLLGDYVEAKQDAVLAKAAALVEMELLPKTSAEFDGIAGNDDGSANAGLDAFEQAIAAEEATLKALTEDQRIIKNENGENTTVDVKADSDGDGVPDALDAFKDDATEWLDCDKDGTGDNADTDDDGDGVNDDVDPFPYDKTETLDTDGDKIGNNADTDDDGDGYLDGEDKFPLDKDEWADFDKDDIGDNADPDDDNDGHDDVDDKFPHDDSEWADTDKDGKGNNADTDDDGDGYPDIEDTAPLVPLVQPDNYQACLDSLPDADFTDTAGDTITYQTQRSVSWVNNGELTSYNEAFTYMGGGYSWLKVIEDKQLTEVPAWLASAQGNMEATKWYQYNLNGDLASNEMSYVWQDNYLGSEGINRDGSYAGWGSMRHTIPEIWTREQLKLGEVETYYANNVYLAQVHSAATGSSFDSLPLLELKAIREYLGKDIVRVPAGLFDACKMREQLYIKQEDDSWSEVPDVNTSWNLNRGVIKQDQVNPSWAPVYNRQATKVPSLSVDENDAAAEKQKILAQFTSVTDLFAGQVPTVEQLSPLFADTFSFEGLNKAQMLDNIVQNTAAGTTFVNATVLAYHHDNGVAKVSFEIDLSDAPDNLLRTWYVVKNAEGEWQFNGYTAPDYEF